MKRPAVRYIVQRDLQYINSFLPKGEIVHGVDVASMPFNLQKALKRTKERMSVTRPDLTVVAIFHDGQERWVTAPEDVQMYLKSSAGLLRRRVSRDKPTETK